MRHRVKRHRLAKPADQRKAMLRSLATSFIIHEEISTTRERAKALRPIVEKLITLAKRGDLHAIRQAKRWIYDQPTGEMIADKNDKQIEETVLRRLFRSIGPRFAERKGGYTRIIPAPPRRGDASPMAIFQLVD